MVKLLIIWGLIGVLYYKSPIKNTKRTRGRLDRNVAPCSRPTTNVIGPLHECKKDKRPNKTETYLRNLKQGLYLHNSGC